MPYSHWDVVVNGEIGVKQRQSEWSHGASLWFMRRTAAEDYRWFEVSYKHNALPNTSLRGPFSIGLDLANADLAAGPGLHTIEIESGPTAIDLDQADAFIDRWLNRLADAYHGRLRPF